MIILFSLISVPTTVLLLLTDAPFLLSRDRLAEVISFVLEREERKANFSIRLFRRFPLLNNGYQLLQRDIHVTRFRFPL